MNRTRLTLVRLSSLALLCASNVSAAQTREPLCVPVASRRLLAGPALEGSEGGRLIAEAIQNSTDGARFVIAVRDPRHTLASTPAHLIAASAPPDSSPRTEVSSGLSVMRIGEDLRPIGEPSFVRDPATIETPVPIASVSLSAGVLVLQGISAEIRSILIPANGAITPSQSIAEAPAPAAPSGPHGFVWITATARGDGAIALAGTADGAVVGLRFDHHGTLHGSPTRWQRRVGGPLQLVPTPDGPPAAMLGRPVQGTGPQNEQARQQVLVTLDESLNPVGEPFATGFAQFPMAFVARGRFLTVFQWAQQQGVAIATLPVGEHRIGEQLPRLWFAQPPLEGLNLGHGAINATGVIYDLVMYGESIGGGVHGHLAWVPPSGTPIVRRDVLPLRGRMITAPRLIPAADGIVMIAATEDETGAAVDAYHVRCDLVDVPSSSSP